MILIRCYYLVSKNEDHQIANFDKKISARLLSSDKSSTLHEMDKSPGGYWWCHLSFKQKTVHFTTLSYKPTTATALLFSCYSCCSCYRCRLVKAGAGDLQFLIDLKIPNFDLIWLFSKSQCSFQNSRFDDI